MHTTGSIIMKIIVHQLCKCHSCLPPKFTLVINVHAVGSHQLTEYLLSAILLNNEAFINLTSDMDYVLILTKILL